MISDSPSRRLNGGRLLSAIMQMKTTRNASGCLKIYQQSACASTMRLMSKEPVSMTTPMTAKPSGNSYVRSCATARIEPMRPYLLFEAKPPMKNGSTACAEMASRRNSPMFTSAKTTPASKG